MRQTSSYGSSRLAAAALAALVCVGVGCEDERRQANRDLRDAVAAAANDPDERSLLEQTLGRAAAGDATLAVANEVAGQLASSQGLRLMTGPIPRRDAEDAPFRPGLMGLYARAAVLAEEMNALAQQAAVGRLYAQASAGKNPESLVASLRADIEALEGQTWQAAEGREFDGIAAASAERDQLQSRQQELEAEIDRLDTRRRQLLSESNRLEEEADRRTGLASIEQYRQVSGLRDQAAAVGAETDRIAAEVEAVVAGQLEREAYIGALQQGQQALQEQIGVLEQTWGQAREQIAAVEAAAAAVLEGEAGSVAAIGRQYSLLWEEAQAVRTRAVEALDASARSFNSAEVSARSASQIAVPRLQQVIREAFDANRLRLQRGVALRQRGQLHAEEAAALASLVRLNEVIEAAGGQMPAGVPSDPAAAFADNVRAAVGALSEADEQMGNVASSTRQTMARAGYRERAVILVSMQALRTLVDAAGVQIDADLPSAEDLDRRIREFAADANAQGHRLPPLRVFFEALPPEPEPAEPVEGLENGDADGEMPEAPADDMPMNGEPADEPAAGDEPLPDEE